EYQTYQDKLQGPAMTIPQIDLTDAPMTVDLTLGGLAELEDRVPLTGGKAAAMAAFNDFPEIRTPASPLAITIGAYAEHLAPLKWTVETLLGNGAFVDDAQVRFVTLEGEEDFREEHAGDPDALAWLDGFLDEHTAETFLGGVVAAGGLKRMIRDQPLDPTLDAELNAALAAQFSALAPAQGLRFRSSSTAEDIQGFNGAGLYDSNTGYLDPSLQTEPKLQDRDLAWALKKTWASYWGFEAFAERRSAGIDHMSGHMGVLVHPRFDDALEDANGVITLYLARESAGPRRQMVVNAQDGEISVTNPDPDNPTTPEIAQVWATGEDVPTLERLQASSEVAAGDQVIGDAELLWLFQVLSPLIEAWLDTANTQWVTSQHRSTLVLDFEFKRMLDGWPALASGETTDGGLVLKQVRTLDSPIPALDPDILADAVPRDVLEQVVRVIRRRCDAGPVHLETTEYFTDPARSWALDHAIKPFNSTLEVTLIGDVEALGLGNGDTFAVDHTEAAFSHPDMEEGGPWSLQVTMDGEASVLGLTALALTDGGSWSLTAAGQSSDGDGVECEVQELHEGPAAYLASLLEAP
ncbi:MAG: PEP/pyruvate-binding domain-containing protein, partial [Myxococcota bacterium]|nr:PEP/pyruvate-binding domain-containing protein [Myxococcota bacterium]